MKRLAFALLLVAACGATDVDEPPSTVTTSVPVSTPPETVVTTVAPEAPSAIGDADVVLVAELVGGCAMMGPNCPTFVLWGDGRAVLVRGTPPVDPFLARIDDAAVEGVGFIDAALAAGVASVALETDFSALVGRLGPGRCNACVDGIDTVITVATPAGPVTLASTDVEFDRSEPFFAAVGAAVDALERDLQLTLESR